MEEKPYLVSNPKKIIYPIILQQNTEGMYRSIMLSLMRFLYLYSLLLLPFFAVAQSSDSLRLAHIDTTLSYDLRGERLIDVAKKIARLSARNVIVPELLYDCKVSGYVRRMPFDDALRTLASVNGLLVERGLPVEPFVEQLRGVFSELNGRIDRTGHVEMPEHLREAGRRTIDAEIERRKTEKQNTNP